MIRLLIIIICLMSCNCIAISKTLYLRDYGILEASTHMERYEILRLFYSDVHANNATASYEGINNLVLELPPDVRPIQLPEENDFSNVTIKVINKQKDVYLFELTSPTSDVTISKEEVCSGHYSSPLLLNGNHLLLLQDKNLWTKREGFEEYIHRNEVLIVKNGKALNKTISPYNSDESMPSGKVISISERGKSFSNLVFERDSLSIFKTGIVCVSNQYNFEMRNVHLNTPINTVLYEDKAIQINSSAKVVLKDIAINGTYSQVNKWGYGINLNNIYDLRIQGIKAEANWGVFGCVYINHAEIKDCDMNRFDLHCYGCDFDFANCTFRGSEAMPYSCFYGKMLFRNCRFLDAEPLHFRQEYNANTPHDIYFCNCIFKLTSNYNGIVRMNRIKSLKSGREELKDDYLPNIRMKNCDVYVPNSVKRWHLAIVGNDSGAPMKGLNQIIIDGLKIHCNHNTVFDPFSEEIETIDSLYIKIRNAVCEFEDGVNQPLYIKEATQGSKVSITCNKRIVHRRNSLLGFNDIASMINDTTYFLIASIIGLITFRHIKENNKKSA